MFSNALTLIGKPYRTNISNSISLSLYSWNELSDSLDYKYEASIGGYADYCYSIELNLDSLPPIQKISVFVNGYECKISNYYAGKIEFQEPRIFLDSFGFAQIDFIFEMQNFDEINCSTIYFPVLVVDSINNLSVQRMVKTIYEKSPRYLFGNQQRSQDKRSLGNSQIHDLDGQIETLGKIVTCYEENFRYFKTNAVSRLEQIESIKSYEKVKNITLKSIQYIVQHPEQLQKSLGLTGVRIEKSNYFPYKALITESKNNYDIYENRVIVGFLLSVYKESLALYEKIEKQLVQFDFPSTPSVEGYTSSAVVILDIGKSRLRKAQLTLQRLFGQLEKLYNIYSRMLSVSTIVVSYIPKPTSIFKEIKPYRTIYNLMIEWFMYGSYNFERENILLPLLRSHKIYEMYALIQLLDFISQENYVLESSMHYRYSNLGDKAYVQDVSAIPNTFNFTNKLSKKHITLYYEPAIQGRSHIGENDITLYRNNSVSLKATRTARPYRPDYIMKIQNENEKIYFILDAKFSQKSRVLVSYFPELAYKYLFSISPIDNESHVKGLIVLNGKGAVDSESDDEISNFYDNELDDYQISPTAKIFTLTERTEKSKELHFNLFRSLFEKYI